MNIQIFIKVFSFKFFPLNHYDRFSSYEHFYFDKYYITIYWFSKHLRFYQKYNHRLLVEQSIYSKNNVVRRLNLFLQEVYKEIL